MRLSYNLALVLLFASSITLIAQETPTSYWKTGGDVSITFFQSSFTNWTDGGGNPTTNFGGLVNLFAKYQKDKKSWTNTALLQYGIQKVGEDADFVKNIDKIELLSIAGYSFNKHLHYSALFSLKTQLTVTRTSNDAIQSDFFAPAEILLAPGIKYSKGDKKSKDNIFINFSPATAKFLIVANDSLADAGTFTGVAGERFRTEFGASLIGNYRTNFLEQESIKGTLTTGLELFSNYLENPQDIDIKWTNVLAFNFFKYFTATFTTDLRYDAQVAVPLDRDDDGVFESTGPRVRFAQTFGVGFGYKF